MQKDFIATKTMFVASAIDPNAIEFSIHSQLQKLASIEIWIQLHSVCLVFSLVFHDFQVVVD